ncbi:MAG: TatD family hydrolase [Bacteroides sp.]|nr:TatD family hydrolase [Bacteroides sp.]
MDFFNIHTHTLTCPESEILSQSPLQFPADKRTIYTSIGIHPWELTEENAEDQQKSLQKLISNASVIAIGESGLDKLQGPSIDVQTNILRQQILLSETYSLPLILHCVKAFNELIQLKKEIKPQQPWIIHGFRGKEALATDCIRHGFYLSFGEYFQENALKATPLEKLFIETDESEKPIGSIYQTISDTCGIPLKELNDYIKKNVKKVFFKA